MYMLGRLTLLDLDKGDRFKVIYTERFVDDSVSVGIEKIKAAYFEHRNKPLYAFEFQTDSVKGIVDYFDAECQEPSSCLSKGARLLIAESLHAII